MRRLLALALPLVALCGLVPAAAAPVATERMAAVRITLPAADGDRVELQLWAVAGARGDRLEVASTHCGTRCTAPVYYAGRLARGGLRVDPAAAEARLTAIVGGIALDVTWAPAAGTGVVAGGLRGAGNDNGSVFAVYRGDPAVATVRTDVGGCRGSAYVGDELSVWTSDAGDPSSEPLSRLRLAAVGAPVCEG
jgi:hypothetical protein